MTIQLPPELEQFVREQISNGYYDTESEAFLHAMELLRDWHHVRQMRLDDVRKKVMVGVEQLERGEYKEYDDNSLDELFQEIRNNTLARLAEQRRDAI
jgi:putative addiction module CopG family antidote